MQCISIVHRSSSTSMPRSSLVSWHHHQSRMARSGVSGTRDAPTDPGREGTYDDGVTDYPLVNLFIAIENCHLWNLWWVFSYEKRVIFNSYFSLPQGTWFYMIPSLFDQRIILQISPMSQYFGNLLLRELDGKLQGIRFLSLVAGNSIDLFAF